MLLCSVSHTKTSLVGTSLCIPITDGRLNLGTWQGNFRVIFSLVVRWLDCYIPTSYYPSGQASISPSSDTRRIPDESLPPSCEFLSLTCVRFIRLMFFAGRNVAARPPRASTSFGAVCKSVPSAGVRFSDCWSPICSQLSRESIFM